MIKLGRIKSRQVSPRICNKTRANIRSVDSYINRFLQRPTAPHRPDAGRHPLIVLLLLLCSGGHTEPGLRYCNCFCSVLFLF